MKLIVDKYDEEIGEHIVQRVEEGFKEAQVYDTYIKLVWLDFLGCEKRTEIVKYANADLLSIMDNGKFLHLMTR